MKSLFSLFFKLFIGSFIKHNLPFLFRLQMSNFNWMVVKLSNRSKI